MVTSFFSSKTSTMAKVFIFVCLLKLFEQSTEHQLSDWWTLDNQCRFDCKGSSHGVYRLVLWIFPWFLFQKQTFAIIWTCIHGFYASGNFVIQCVYGLAAASYESYFAFESGSYITIADHKNEQLTHLLSDFASISLCSELLLFKWKVPILTSIFMVSVI